MIATQRNAIKVERSIFSLSYIQAQKSPKILSAIIKNTADLNNRL